MEDLADEQLASRIEQGDQAAEAEFYRRFFPRIRMMLERRTRSFADAQDLAQDAILTVLVKVRLGEIKDNAQIGGYLHQTAKFLFIGRARESSRRKTDTVADIPISYQGEITDELTTVIDREAKQNVRSLLAEMNQERDRQILLQHYLLDRSKEVVSENLGLTADQFDRVIHRARARFRALIESQMTVVQGSSDAS